jgi:hypothetical protein
MLSSTETVPPDPRLSRRFSVSVAERVFPISARAASPALLKDLLRAPAFSLREDDPSHGHRVRVAVGGDLVEGIRDPVKPAANRLRDRQRPLAAADEHRAQRIGRGQSCCRDDEPAYQPAQADGVEGAWPPHAGDGHGLAPVAAVVPREERDIADVGV